MYLSKTMFLNAIRCKNYLKIKEKLNFYKNSTLEDLIEYEQKEKMKNFISNILDEDVEEDINLESMMKYYKEIENIAASYVDFDIDLPFEVNKNLVTSDKVEEQFRIYKEVDGFKLFAFADIFRTNSLSSGLYEVKATTTRRFIDTGAFDEKLKLIYNPEETDKKKLKAIEKLGKLKEVKDLLYQAYVLGKEYKGTKVNYYLIVLNKDFIHGVDDLAVNSDCNIIKAINLTDYVNDYAYTIEDDLNFIKSINLDEDLTEIAFSQKCAHKKTTECEFFNHCFPHANEKNSVFTLFGNINLSNKRKKENIINEGFKYLEDLNLEDFVNPKHLLQYNKETYINKEKIKLGLSQLKYPIYHLDFETFNCPIPRFIGEKPYTQSVFQYSLHIEREPGVCDFDNDHFEFVSKNFNEDVRLEIIKGLLENIKDDGGTIMAYNATFEKQRIKELSNIYMNYTEDLMKLHDRIFDLMYIVKGNSTLYKSLGIEEDENDSGLNFYHEDLHGSYSLKKVLPICSNYSYNDMEVGNGQEAMVAYQQLTEDNPNKEQIINNLIKYCKLDTYAMFEVLNYFRKLVE